MAVASHPRVPHDGPLDRSHGAFNPGERSTEGDIVSRFWMVRAGEGGYLFPEFERTGRIGIDWEFAGDFTEITTLEAMKSRIAATDPTRHPSALANSASMAFKFRVVMQKGDRVVTYDPQSRQYLMGTIAGDYEYGDSLKDSPHTRRVEWRGHVSRDVLRPASRNTLGNGSRWARSS